MTVIAIMAAVIAFGSCGERTEQSNSEEVDTEIAELRIELEETRSELRAALAQANPNETKGVGNPSCLGVDGRKQPNSLFTITVRLDSQYSISNWSSSPVTTRLRNALGTRYNPEPDEEEFKALGARISEWGHTQAIPGEPCNFWVRVQPDSISADELWDKWRWMGHFFGGAVNPGVFRSL